MIKHYHIWRGSKRTSVSVHKTLDILLSLRVAGTPESTDKHAKKAVIQWVQNTINKAGPDQKNLSQWLQGQALEFIMTGENMPQLWKNWKKIENYASKSSDTTELE